MNSYSSSIFKLLFNAADTLRIGIDKALTRYQEEMRKVRTEAARLKDEDGYISSKQHILAEITRQEITKCQRAFADKVLRYGDQLSDELKKHTLEPVDGTFRNSLSMVREFRIPLSRTQIEALLKQNNGNALGLQALDQVLKDTESEFHVVYKKISEFESDLNSIKALGIQPVPHDLNLHHEMTEIMGGTPILSVRNDGTTFENGAKFDNTSLLLRASEFESQMERIKSIEASWNGDIVYTLSDDPEERSENEDIVSEVRIADSNLPGEKLARKLGKEASDRSRAVLSELQSIASTL